MPDKCARCGKSFDFHLTEEGLKCDGFLAKSFKDKYKCKHCGAEQGDLHKIDCPELFKKEVCASCDPSLNEPGRTIAVDDKGNCVKCGRIVAHRIWSDDPDSLLHSAASRKRWDIYFRGVCAAVAFKSPCLSRQIGAILVRDKSIVSTGYNGPARGYPHCKDGKSLGNGYACPRRLKGYKSGEGLSECPAAHAETNCIANAARIGASTVGSTLYMNCILPCKDCAVLLVNAGITEIVVEDTKPYHYMSVEIFKHARIKTRRFDL